MLADRIRKARRNARLTQTALAAAVKVTPSAVAQWERPRGTTPSLRSLFSIAEATSSNFQWLATGRGLQASGESHASYETLRLDLFAEDSAEESMLRRFRALSLRERQLLADLLEEMAKKERDAY